MATVEFAARGGKGDSPHLCRPWVHGARLRAVSASGTQRVPGPLFPLRRLVAACLAAAALAFPAAAAKADLVRILHDNCEAAQARIDLVQQACQEINASYYIVGDDDIPLVFLALLRDAARRGVVVRLIVDGQGSNNQMPRALEAHLICEGVQIREFHPKTPGELKWRKHRSHDKLLVVDGAQMITGGRNVKNEYFGFACRNYVDRDVYLRGCTAAEARCYFLCRWLSDEVLPARLPCCPDKKIMALQNHPELNDGCDQASICRAGLLLDQALCSVPARGLVRLGACCDWSAGAREVACIQFLHDIPDVDKRRAGIGRDMIELLATAQCSLVLETPYLALSHEMKRTLERLCRRGVHVTILTNSLETNDEKPAQALYENDKRRFLRWGIELWELHGCDHLHAKAAVIDGCVAVIGSYNFDELSQKKNSEVAVAIYDPPTAAELWCSISVHLERAWQIGRNTKPIGSATKYPGADRRQVRELRKNRIVVPFVKRFL